MSIDTQHFAKLLDEELNLARQIHDLMHQERGAIRANDIGTLQHLRTSSSQCLQQLRDHASQRLQWMQNKGMDSADTCLNHPDIHPAANINRLWQELEQQYNRNRKLSQQLSDIVLTARHRTVQKLKILRGRDNDPHLYNDQGKENHLNNGRGYIEV